MPTLFMVELAVSDVAASRAWYETALGLTVVTRDATTGFVLLRDERGGRLALKPGFPGTGGVTLHFEVADVEAALRDGQLVAEGAVVVSPEGYREAFVRDPDGYRVGVFAWNADTSRVDTPN